MSTKGTSVADDYLQDLGQQLREYALEAKKRADAGGRSDFDCGYLSGFHRVISLMQQQAETFGIPLEDLGLAGIDADEDLI